MDALTAQLATQRSNIEVAQRNVEVADRNLADTIVRAPFAGIVTVKAVTGGLDVADPENNDPAVIASAAVEVRLELP